jgi:mRNA interferase MazF
MNEIKRGDVWLIDLGMPDGTSKQSGVRPVVITSNDMANKNSSVIHIVPLTTKTKNKLPTHIQIDVQNKITGVITPSVALAEQVTLVDKSLLYKKIGEVDATKMDSLDVCLMIQFNLYDKVKNIIKENRFLKQKLQLVGC